jgi:hypothetical protein
MQITVNIPDEVVAQAQARGLSPERYVEGLVANQAAEVSESGGTTLKVSELKQFFATMAKDPDESSQLREEAFTRESFYQDHG